MAADARKKPKFPWDYEVPNTAFWNDLSYAVGVGFLRCYSDAEISRMTFDERLSTEDKLKYLLETLQTTFSEKEQEAAPTPLREADHSTWSRFQMGMSSLQHSAGNTSAEEKLARERYENGPDGTKDLSALHHLATIMEATGRYAEGEAMAHEVLPWLEGHEKLGKDSPQAISCMRILAACTWKQKKYDEGEEWVDRCRSTVDSLDTGKFAKYKVAEVKQVDDMIAELEDWKKEHGGP
ncbi:hypothetical protein LSUE1_G007174 [Lachnellula suecica]|uniref:Uncharacterized protein n=1 Tax=Lachnellula suecica TaxID=602035 RepID=A0A8T9C3Q0_9HELO|nr:hypothetical protein LSUE1_G007174 [Lachnellula suecica]